MYWGRGYEGGGVRVAVILGSIACSAIVSVKKKKKLAIHYFAIVDSYVKEICDKTDRSNQETLSIIRKLQRSSVQEV